MCLTRNLTHSKLFLSLWVVLKRSAVRGVGLLAKWVAAANASHWGSSLSPFTSPHTPHGAATLRFWVLCLLQFESFTILKHPTADRWLHSSASADHPLRCLAPSSLLCPKLSASSHLTLSISSATEATNRVRTRPTSSHNVQTAVDGRHGRFGVSSFRDIPTHRSG